MTIQLLTKVRTVKNIDICGILVLILGFYVGSAHATSPFPAFTTGADYFQAPVPTSPTTYCKGSNPEATAACVTNFLVATPPPTGCSPTSNDPTFSCLPVSDPAYDISN